MPVLGITAAAAVACPLLSLDRAYRAYRKNDTTAQEIDHIYWLLLHDNVRFAIISTIADCKRMLSFYSHSQSTYSDSIHSESCKQLFPCAFAVFGHLFY